MTADTAGRPGRTPRPRRARGAAESLGSIVLAFESVVVFLAGLVVFGLKALPESIPAWWGIVGGAVMAILMIAVSGVLRHRWGIILGWVLQIIVALASFLVPAIAFVAIIFGGMWAYATIKGASLDRRNARLSQGRDTPNGE
ncbi:hypothetical protein CVS47_01558 [Microbacterium lemovicicum]|uniref:Allophanate hydrolase n=1 Tax=Microbacterium lemovicicum TaxID=1072463 RepID=A0A3S9WA65_9MICO|nr:DUF4233 domain-containing protein [Microbacterium lemovicicum]AZS36937.1 hypothetical protein CVS47_01558 [Microbacterium lemovicicum]